MSEPGTVAAVAPGPSKANTPADSACTCPPRAITTTAPGTYPRST